MKKYEEKLKEFMVKNRISAKHISFEKSCHSVKEAADSVGANKTDFIKSLCFFDNNEKLIVAIIKGEDKADESKIKEICNVKKVNIANPNLIKEHTGYPCGGVPPFGYNALFLIDEKVMKKSEVYAGGGSSQSLIKVSTETIKEVNDGKIADIVR